MKIFGIGMHKTGTTTLTECFRILGFNVCPEALAYSTIQNVSADNYRPCLLVAREYEAFADSPWNFVDAYRVLDAVFPDAKFILTTRDESRWFKSSLRWASLNNTAGATAVLSTIGAALTVGNRAQVLDGYRQHNNGVLGYFSDPRETVDAQKLLVVDWEMGDGWEKLCTFLNKPVPERDFPHMLKYDAETLSYVDTVRRRGSGT